MAFGSIFYKICLFLSNLSLSFSSAFITCDPGQGHHPLSRQCNPNPLSIFSALWSSLLQKKKKQTSSCQVHAINSSFNFIKIIQTPIYVTFIHKGSYINVSLPNKKGWGGERSEMCKKGTQQTIYIRECLWTCIQESEICMKCNRERRRWLYKLSRHTWSPQNNLIWMGHPD